MVWPYFLATDAAGATIPDSRTWYKPYGDIRAGGSSLPTDFTYTGQRSESSLGLLDYRARMYDSLLARFLSADTVAPEPGNPQALNRYSYCLGNPVKYTDPSGHVFCPVCVGGGQVPIGGWGFGGIGTALVNTDLNNYYKSEYRGGYQQYYALETEPWHSYEFTSISDEPEYEGFDEGYGHRWSDGGTKYGRMSPEQVANLKYTAMRNGRDIHITGGWAETERGVQNRINALREYGPGKPAPKYGMDSMQYGPREMDLSYRGYPTSGLPGAKADLDIWSPRNQGQFTGPSPAVRQALQSIFGVSSMDNYNRYWGYGPPPGTITFCPNGTTIRTPALWQLLPEP